MKKALLFFTMLMVIVTLAFSQQRQVTGKVTGSDGAPIPFATVQIKGTNTGTTSDQSGNFKLNVSGDQAVLTVTSVGFTAKDVTVGTSGTVSVTLESSSESLQEVVVTALGIQRNKNELPYAAQQVKADEIVKTRTNNFANSLSGKVAGLQIKTNNTMGGSTNIIMRGYKSITNNNQALMVIDGVPIDNSNINTPNQQRGRGGFDYGNAGADVNPDDIESVNVLKGAAATALYGSRAANGVVLITTKKGRKGLGISVNIGGSTGFMDKSTWVKYQHEYGGGYYDPDLNRYSGPSPDDGPPGPHADLRQFDVNGDGVPDLVVPTTEDASFGARFDPNLQVYNWNAFDPRSPTYLKSSPWVAAKNDPTEFFETPVSTSTSVFIDGGGDKATFKLGYTRANDKGILPNSKLTKDMANFQASYNITDRLTASATVNFTKQTGQGRYGTGYGDARSLIGGFRQWWQMNVDIKELKDAYFRTGDNVTWNPSEPPDDLGPIYWDNPYFSRYQSYENDSRYRYIGNITLNYKATDWLSFLGRIALDSYDQLQEERDGYGSVNVSSYSKFNYTFREFNYDFMANFNKDLSSKLNLKALLGANLRQNYLNSTFAQTNGGLVIPKLYSLSNSANPIEAPTEQDQRQEVGGVFGGFTFTYDNFLILDVTARNDKSSTLPKGNNSYFYPSVSAGFIFSKLMPNANWLSFGKLRLNYAEVGNSAPWGYTIDSYTKPTPYGSIPIFTVANPPRLNDPSNSKKNQDLKPERTKSYEAGIEASFLNNRIGFDVTYYKTNTIDQTIPVSVSAATGYTIRVINAGNVENKGIEVALRATPVKTENFSWDININWARSRTEVLSLVGGTQNILMGSGGFQGGVSLNAAVGQPFGVLRGSDFVYKDGKRVVGEDGYYVVSQSTNNIIGDINPDWTGGVSNTLTYKNLALSFLVDARIGGSVFSIDRWYGEGTGLYETSVGLNDQGKPVRDPIEQGGGVIFEGVTEDGKENTQRVPLTGLRGYGYNNFPNSAYVYDASYIKLREVNLTYSFPDKLISRINPVKGIDFSLYGRNLWIIHKNLPDADPEDNAGSGNVQGFQVASYPVYRTVGFNLKFRF